MSSPLGALHDNVLDAVGTGIVSGALAPGEVVTLEDIGVRHGVSRSVAREAIRVLESMGLIAARRRVGIIVQPPHRWNVFDPRVIRWRIEAGDRAAQLVSLSELRRGFEPAAAALAASRANPQQCRVLAATVSDMAVQGRAGDLDGFLNADKTFHRTLLQASGNEMFRALDGVVAAVLTARTHHGMMPQTPNPAAIALHDDVARAVRNGDEAGAERAMRAIIAESVLHVNSTRLDFSP